MNKALRIGKLSPRMVGCVQFWWLATDAWSGCLGCWAHSASWWLRSADRCSPRWQVRALWTSRLCPKCAQHSTRWSPLAARYKLIPECVFFFSKLLLISCTLVTLRLHQWIQSPGPCLTGGSGDFGRSGCGDWRPAYRPLCSRSSSHTDWNHSHRFCLTGFTPAFFFLDCFSS